MEDNNELQERINSIKNISYFVVHMASKNNYLHCPDCACRNICDSFLGEWYNTKLIEIGAFSGIAVIIISIAFLHIYFRKQYLLESDNGKLYWLQAASAVSVNSMCIIRAIKSKTGRRWKLNIKKSTALKFCFPQWKKPKP